MIKPKIELIVVSLTMIRTNLEMVKLIMSLIMEPIWTSSTRKMDKVRELVMNLNKSKLDPKQIISLLVRPSWLRALSTP